MKPGRELDALVAEKVFGSQRPGPPPDVWPHGAFVSRDERWQFSDMIGEWCAAPYSTDIGAAWQVVERLIALVESGSVGLEHHGGSRWEVTWYRDGAACFTMGATAPLAICLAALRAVGVDVAGAAPSPEEEGR